jgi:hypothetical protein
MAEAYARIADKYISRDGGRPAKKTVWAPVTILEKERGWLEAAVMRGGYLPTRERDGDKAPFLSELRAMHTRGLIQGMPWRITKFGRDCLRELEQPDRFSVPISIAQPEAARVRPLAEIEREAILSALQSFAGNKSRTARALGISVRTLQNRLAEYGSENR